MWRLRPNLAPRMLCTVCDHRGADVSPSWFKSRLIGPTPSPIPTQRRANPHRRQTSGGLDVTLSGPQQRILNSLATWKQIGEAPPSNAQVAWLAGNSPSSSSYANPRSALKTAGLIEYPMPNRLLITGEGAAQATPFELQTSLLDFVVGCLPGLGSAHPKGNRRALPQSRGCIDPNAAAGEKFKVQAANGRLLNNLL
jgi:hypothetical protein